MKCLPYLKCEKIVHLWFLKDRFRRRLQVGAKGWISSWDLVICHTWGKWSSTDSSVMPATRRIALTLMHALLGRIHQELAFLSSWAWDFSSSVSRAVIFDTNDLNSLSLKPVQSAANEFCSIFNEENFVWQMLVCVLHSTCVYLSFKDEMQVKKHGNQLPEGPLPAGHSARCHLTQGGLGTFGIFRLSPGLVFKFQPSSPLSDR